MEPTYRDGGFNFCFRWRYLFTEPKHGDVVVLRLAGTKILLLKRVVALSGETVAFKDGVLWLEGKQYHEPYISSAGNWNLEPRKVGREKVYVVGDNRTVPIDQHHFGQVERKRIIGGVLW